VAVATGEVAVVKSLKWEYTYGLSVGTKSSGSCRTSREVAVSGGSTVGTK